MHRCIVDPQSSGQLFFVHFICLSHRQWTAEMTIGRSRFFSGAQRRSQVHSHPFKCKLILYNMMALVPDGTIDSTTGFSGDNQKNRRVSSTNLLEIQTLDSKLQNLSSRFATIRWPVELRIIDAKRISEVMSGISRCWTRALLTSAPLTVELTSFLSFERKANCVEFCSEKKPWEPQVWLFIERVPFALPIYRSRSSRNDCFAEFEKHGNSRRRLLWRI